MTISGSWRRSWARLRVLEVPTILMVWDRDAVGEEIGCGIALENGSRDKPARAVRGDVFHAVNCTVDLPGKDRIVKGPDKNPLPADLVEGHLGGGVPLRADDHFFRPDPQCGQFSDDRLCLDEGQLAAPVPIFTDIVCTPV